MKAFINSIVFASLAACTIAPAEASILSWTKRQISAVKRYFTVYDPSYHYKMGGIVSGAIALSFAGLIRGILTKRPEPGDLFGVFMLLPFALFFGVASYSFMTYQVEGPDVERILRADTRNNVSGAHEALASFLLLSKNPHGIVNIPLR